MADLKLWVYHGVKSPCVISDSEWESYQAEGWSDTPATFINLDDLGIDTNDEIVVQEFGAAVERAKDRVNEITNDLPDFNVMSRVELINWAKEHLDIEFPTTVKIKTLKRKISEYVNAGT